MLITDIKFRDYAYLKKLGNSYKLVKCNEVCRKGYENVDVTTDCDSVFFKNGYKRKVYKFKESVANFSCENECNGKVRETTNDEKLSNNITRARNKILEYVLCNDFVFFVTLTLNPDLYDRDNLKLFIKKLGYFIQNYKRRINADIKYILIPEQHEDGCWHMHGFIMGLPYDRLELFDINGEKPLPKYIVEKRKKGYLLYNFPAYEKHFGYNVFEPIRNKKASVLYMSKYLTKDISRNVTELGYHLYYCSKGLKKAEIIKQGQFLDSDYHFDFCNEYGGQSFFDYLSENELQEISDKIGSAPLSIEDYRRGYRVQNGWKQFVDCDTGEIISDKYKEYEVF